MVKPIDADRWLAAQTAEGEYWQQLRGDAGEFTRIVAENAGAAQWAASQIPSPPDGDWVEIGIGPLGIGCLHFVPGADSGRRLIGVEPLPLIDAETLALPEPLMALARAARAQRYEHHQAKGEDTGLPGGGFSLGVCYNVLDHVHDPNAILDELHRLLRPGGTLLLGVDTLSMLSDLKFHAWVKRRYANSIGVRAHPHHFRIAAVRALVAAAGFRVLAERVPRHERWQDLAGHSYRLLMVCERLEAPN